MSNKNKEMTECCAAREYLKEYIKNNNNISEIYDLFQKETLVENVDQSNWDWSIQDEMNENKLSEENAIKITEKWFMSMSKEELWERINPFGQNELIINKAYDLGFEIESES